MKPTVVLAETVLADGTKLSLRSHDGEHQLRIGTRLLISTTATESESRMADLGCERIAGGAGRVLIGGLGFGFTLRRALELVGPGARVEVAELVPEVVAWNREHLSRVNGRLLDDPRVAVVVDDVLAVLARADPASYDAVLLDVDNGPAALVDARNERIYADRGLATVARALRPRGRAVFWSGARDDAFVRRLERAGFRARSIAAKPHATARTSTHALFVADLDR